MLGWIATFLLASAGIPQTIKVWREGNAKGLSWYYLILLWSGFVTMGIHTYLQRAGWALTVSYGVQVILFTLMIIRKRFPIAQRA